MQGTFLYGPRDVRFEQRDLPRIIEPTDAIIRMAASCVCGSDLWPYRGIQPISREINPGNVFDLTLPLNQVAEGYRAMDERQAIKALLQP